jgi:hypothetical protein
LLENDLFFKEIADSGVTSQEGQKVYSDLMETVIKLLLQEDSQAFSYVAGRFVLNFIEHKKRSENTETLNKHFLLSFNEDFDFAASVARFFT